MKFLKLSIFKILLLAILPYSLAFAKIQLTQQQKEWIEQNPVVLTGGGYDWAPFDFVKDKHRKPLQHVGISHDILDLISAKTGLKFEYEVDHWSNNLAKIKNGKLDLLPIINKTPQREDFLAFTHPYYDMFNYFFIRSDLTNVSIEDYTNLRVAIPRDFSYEVLLKINYPQIQVITTDSLSEAIFAVLNDEADMLYDSYTALSYTLNKLSVTSIVPFTSSEAMSLNRLYMATSKDNIMLISILNAALSDISASEKNNIFKKWQKNKTNTIYLWLAAALAIISLLIFLRARMLSIETKQREKIQKSLSKERETFKILVESSPDGIMVAVDKQIVDCNKAVIKMLGFNKKEEVIDSNLTDFIQAYQPDGSNTIKLIKSMLQKCLTDGYARYKLQIHAKNSQEFWIDVIQTPIKYLGKNGIYIIWRDISKQVTLNQQLIDAQNQATKANQAKSQFLANMSHEIRTPMNAIIGFTDVLSERVDDKNLNKIISTIKSAGNNLLDLINDILDISKIESGKIVIQKKATNIYDLFNEICQLFSISINKKDISFEIDISSDIPPSLIIDPQHFRQVLLNLLGNALKFTNKGTISFSAKVIKNDNHLSKVDILVDITDTGIGIKENQLEHIFEAFEQQEGQDCNLYKGTGLGLAISKKLAEIMNGEISVTSKINQGSTFSVRLSSVDIAAVDTSTVELYEETSASKTIFNNARILLVDDIEYNRFLVTEIFSNSKLEFIEAQNGTEAIEAVKKIKIDLILMDIRMPKMGGYAATKHIKKSHPLIPIIALTASILDSTDTSIFDSYIRKPIDKDRLIKLMASYLPHTTNTINGEQDSIELRADTLNHSQKKKLLYNINEKCNGIWEKSITSNHLSDITEFSELLDMCNIRYNSQAVKKYVNELNNSIEIFDIAEIKKMLQAFQELKKSLETRV